MRAIAMNNPLPFYVNKVWRNVDFGFPVAETAKQIVQLAQDSGLNHSFVEGNEVHLVPNTTIPDVVITVVESDRHE